MSRWLKVVGIVLAVVLGLAALAAAWGYWTVARSLPQLEGTVEAHGLSAPVIVDRDHLGVPTIRGENRADVAWGLGFVHAQDRFFQMDLLRRRAAGELAELFGPAAVAADRDVRVHRFRRRARGAVRELPRAHTRLLQAYADGVNTGLGALRAKPFEYLLLRTEPAPWRPEDSMLVNYAMYLVLNDSHGRGESDRGLMEELLPAELVAFLAPPGTEWDAPLIGEPFRTPPIPSVIGDAAPAEVTPRAPSETALPAAASAGSNNWAVAGSRTADGRAIVADDMHLGMAVPNTWYRAMMEWRDGGGPRRITGVTAPGSPVVIAGSTTRVAWGFTNTQGDWSDLVVVELDPDDSSRYRTPDGWREIETVREQIAVNGGEPETVEVQTTIWGPIVDRDHRGRPRALRWIAHDPAGADVDLLLLETVSTVEEALDAANRAGIPPQNFVCADATGAIGWTIIGAIPRRVGFSGCVPTSWADGDRGWDGWLEPGEYPRIVDPPDGILWTANARTVDGEWLETIGDGGYVDGARARQIRDHLLSLESPDERDMLTVQLDDRALFLERWRGLLLELLDEDSVRGEPERAELRRLVDSTWTGRASIDSQAYRLVRAFRSFTFERVYERLTAPCAAADERFSIYRIHQTEGPLWRLVTEQPPHLLAPGVASWRELLLEVADTTIGYYRDELGGELADMTWGARNTLAMRHPLSRAVPALSRWLDMPAAQLPGDSRMPRVQSPTWGASERFAVSPGRKADGYFHMPGGQSGHPLSPYYRPGHRAWAEGAPTPFLPGETEHRLVLTPGPATQRR